MKGESEETSNDSALQTEQMYTVTVYILTSNNTVGHRALTICFNPLAAQLFHTTQIEPEKIMSNNII